MKKNLIVLLVFVMGCLSVEARPAFPGKRTVTLSDGRQVVLTFRGDEHFSFFTDEAGLAYQRTANNGFRQISLEEVRETWTSRMQEANEMRARHRTATRAGDPVPNLKGKKKGLVILMQFGDYDFVTKNPKAVFQDFFNKEGYNDFGMSGSVKDYFKAQSYGQFELDFDVVGPYTAAHSMVYYGGHEGSSKDSRPQELIKEACELADEEVNFADYDWDGNGEVDQVFVVYAGYGENYDYTEDNKFANTIWPHESSLKYFSYNLRLDGTLIGTYACNSELAGIDGTELDGIGGACHEFSHCLGLPDFYDTSGNNFGMAVWDVMDQGCYNNNSRTPAGYTSYERMFAGWLTPVELELNSKTTIEGMKPLAESPEAYILYNEKNKNEYYLLENRQLTGFDAKLYGHGLLVLHVDYDADVWHSNSVNVSASHQRLTIIPADNELVYSYNSFAADPFPGKKGVTELTNYSTPAATLYNANTDGKKLMGKPIDNIKESDKGLISFVACRPELGIPELGEAKAVAGQPAFTVNWSAVKDAVGYELEVSETGTASEDPSDALEREFDFETFVSKSAGLSDISTKMADYGLENWKGSKLYTSPNKLRLGTSTTAGYVRTTTWRVPQSSDMTIVVGAKQYKAGTTVKGKVRVAFGNQGDQATYDEESFELTEDGYMVFHFSIRKDLFWIEVRPETCMYLNYLAIYDGEWTAEQLGLNNGARQKVPKKATTVKTYTTDKTSYTIENVNTKHRFNYRVRAFEDGDIYSLWSSEKQFAFSEFVARVGDVNSDGDVDAKDIADIVSYMMGKSPSNFDAKAADINNDGKVNIADILQIDDLILSGK
jgi:M6 family metalloprotease-like protein